MEHLHTFYTKLIMRYLEIILQCEKNSYGKLTTNNVFELSSLDYIISSDLYLLEKNKAGIILF